MAGINYMGAMTQGLAARLGYDKLKPKGSSRIMMGKSEDLTDRHDRQEKSKISIDQAKADVERTKATTEINIKKNEMALKKSQKELEDMENPPELTAMQKAKLRAQQLENVSVAMKNIGGFLANAPQDQYRDLYSLAVDENHLPSYSMTHPDVIESMNPVEYEVSKSKQSLALSGISPKSVEKIEADRRKIKAAKLIQDAKVLAAEKKDKSDTDAKKAELARKLVETSLTKYGDVESMPPRIRRSYYKSLEILEDRLGTEPEPPPNLSPNAHPANRGEPMPQEEVASQEQPQSEVQQGNGQPLDAETAALLVKEAGGDKDLARERAIEKGYSLPQIP